MKEDKQVVKLPRAAKPATKVKHKEITIADAGAVIYTELVAAINNFNEQAKKQYPETEAFKRPEFKLEFKKMVYSESIQQEKKLFGAGVVTVDLKQFGTTTRIYNNGISFHTEKQLDNVNAYAPKLYIDAFHKFVESALIYMQALNLDNPEVKKAMEDAITEKSTPASISE